jgi:hypothetical protein
VTSRGVLGVDPGVNGCGCAIFQPCGPGLYLLDRAAYVCNTRRSSSGDVLEDADGMARCVLDWVCPEGFYTIERALLEFPQVYRAGRGKAGADPNDLLTLAAIDGAIVGLLAVPCAAVLPRGWKATMGELPDGTYLPEQRIMGISEGAAGWQPGTGILSPDEVARVETCSRTLFHNVVDGIGIGLHAVGRGLVNGRKRVVHR